MDEGKFITRTEHRADLDREVAALNKSIERLDRDIREGFQEMRASFRWTIGIATTTGLALLSMGTAILTKVWH